MTTETSESADPIQTSNPSGLSTPQIPDTTTPVSSLSLQNIIMSGIGVAMLGATAYFLIRDPVTCNSSSLVRQFQTRFEANHAELVQNWRSRGMAVDPIANMKLNVVSTTTIAKEGGWVVCQMTFNHGKPAETGEFDYMVGKDDAGTLTWRFNGLTPYDLKYLWQ